MMTDHICACCGQSYQTSFIPEKNKTRVRLAMDKQNICWSCAYWMDLSENPPEGFEVIDGICYVVARPVDKMLNLTYGTTLYVVRNQVKIERLANAQLIGKVPDRFAGKFKDTGHGVSKKIYSMLNRNPFVCNARGCWDRYDCFRYNMELEKDGAWNAIPAKHKKGDEECESFIDKELIK